MKKNLFLWIGILGFFLTSCIEIPKYELAFDTNGGSLINDVKFDRVNTIEMPVNPTKDGYAFDGWFWDNGIFEDPFDVISLIEKTDEFNLTVFAKWVETDLTRQLKSIYMLSLEINAFEGTYEQWLESVKGEQGLPGIDGKSPVLRLNENILEWQLEGDQTWIKLLNLNELAGSNGLNGSNGKSAYDIYLEYYPDYIGNETQWINDLINGNLGTVIKHTVSFDSDGGSLVDSVLVEDNKKLNKPQDPIKEGHTFDGWYIDDYEWIFIGYNITEDITLKAKWTVKQYEIQYNLYEKYEAIDAITLYQDESIEHISLSGLHSMLATSNGRIFAWGFNSYGQLGDNTRVDKINPVDITQQFNLNFGETISHLSIGRFYSMLVTTHGRVFTWGLNSSGQLGNGTLVDGLVPAEITNQFNFDVLETVEKIYSGGSHAMLVTSTGRVFTWGLNDQGQLGDGTLNDISVPTDITAQFNFSMGEYVSQINLGEQNSMLVTSLGRVFVWGDNFFGQIGDGTIISRNLPTDITINFNFLDNESAHLIDFGSKHAMLVSTLGRIFTWGRNNSGQLGDGTNISRRLPTLITDRFDFNELETISHIHLNNHSILITSESRVFTWGDNYFYQLGDGTNTSRNLPFEITASFNLGSTETITHLTHTFVLTSAGRMFAWSRNDDGQLGDGTRTNIQTPTSIPINVYRIDVISYDFGTLIYNIYSPTLSGYTFNGWYLDRAFTQLYNSLTMPSEDLVLFAVFIKD